MPQVRLDGLTVYRWPDDPADVLLNGVSVIDLDLEEAAVYPSGYGWVLVRKLQATDNAKRMIDGIYRHHILRGQVTVLTGA